MRLLLGLIVVATMVALSPVRSPGGPAALVAWLTSLAASVPLPGPVATIAGDAMSAEIGRRAGRVTEGSGAAPSRQAGRAPL